jgi:hypothetical protein
MHVALAGQWRYSLMTNKLTATMQIAKRVYSLARKRNDGEKTGGRPSRRNEADAPNAVPLIPLRFEDEQDDENDLVAASPG